MSLPRLALAMALLMAPVPALAQTVKPSTPDAAKADAQKGDAAQPETKKQKKPRSEAQKKNDERMRACGKEWRAAKAANKTDGKTWRQFSTECRRKKKAG